MVKEFKQWLKQKLRNYLEVDNLDKELKEHRRSYNVKSKQLENNIESVYKNLKNDISHFQDSVNILHNTVENVVHIGTDVCIDNRCRNSWAVICVEGKINIVKFVDLNGRDARDILHFLKQFEAGRHCIDTPYKYVFDDEFFKF
jgi:hypothetical protein